MQKRYKWAAAICLTIGIALLSIGLLKKYLDDKQQDSDYAVYTSQTLPAQEKDALSESIRHYNDDRSGYENIPENIGWILIDKLDLKYPVYRTTDDEALAEGIVHVVGTDLPVGDDRTDVMLMGHNGEAGKALFTHLDNLTIGDEVVLDFKTGTYRYTVTGTEVVEPDLVHMYRSDQSTLTLMTCTPYGSNTHRLLVHCTISKGERA